MDTRDPFLKKLQRENEETSEQARLLREEGHDERARWLEIEEAERTLNALEAHYGKDAL